MKVRNRYFLTMAIAWAPCLLAAATSYAVILRPQLDYRKGLEAKIASSKIQYAQALQAAKERDQDRLAAQVESLHRRIGDFVVSLEEAPELAFQIGEMAHEAKLGSFGMRPAHKAGSDSRSGSEHVGEKHVELAFCAGFRRFATLLNALERRRPVVFVETFTISRPPERDVEPQANMELTVLVEKASGPIGGWK